MYYVFVFLYFEFLYFENAFLIVQTKSKASDENLLESKS